MRFTILITGSGGQGVMSAGMSIASTASKMAYATFVPWYGAAQRGGVAKCTVVVSDEPIMSPLPGKCKAMIAMNDDACQKGLSEIREDAIIIRNCNRGNSEIKANAMLIDVPADDMAREAGDARMTNMVLTGVLLGFVGIIELEDVEDMMVSKIAAKNPEAGEITKKALKAGFEWGSDPDHIKELSLEEEPEDDSCKYSIKKTTVGEMLDTPEIRAIAERIFPQVLEHPLIEAGRMFKFADALPYMKDMIKKEELEQFEKELAKLQ